MSAPVIHWFRRDLRLHDNTALHAAMQNGSVIPVFIFDDRLLNSDYVGAPRMAFMHKALTSLQVAIAERSGRLIVRRGHPVDVLRDLIERQGATAVYVNRDYTPFAQRRDAAVSEALSVPVHAYDDAVIMPPGSVLTNNGAPYSVYTPFKNKWRELSKGRELAISDDLPGGFVPADDLPDAPLPSLADLGFTAPFELPDISEEAARSRLDAFLGGPVFGYSESRNALEDDPFTVGGGTSRLSPYFRMGLLSPRVAVWRARDAYTAASDDAARESVTTWVDELIWREFYMHVMAQYPHVAHSNYNDTYDPLEWDNNPEALQAWKDGQTGYPIVDAAMRQLQQTGWMPNRARMIVASFLTKDLLIHWKEGERHFMQHLIDGDPAANNGGWQWAAGTGTDAQPYFRIFNPVSQSKKFDPNGDYIRRWVPELADLGKKAIHAPWEIDRPPSDYPAPIVDHKQARERTLAAFKAAREPHD